MNPSALQALARVLIGLLFVVAGVRKVLAFAGTAGYFGMLGLPMPQVAAALTIVLEIGGGLAVMAGWKLRWTALVMGLFTLATAFVGHAFWAADAAQYAGQLNNFLKNIAIVGGFILLGLSARDRAG